MSQVQNTKQGLKTKDLCTSKSVMTINVTHWDPGQNVAVMSITNLPFLFL